MTKRRYIILISALLLCAAAGAAPVSWQLVTNDCPRLNVAAEIPCGRYGRFYLDNVTPPASCGFIGEGSETPPRYFPVRGIQEFPAEPAPWGRPTDDAPVTGVGTPAGSNAAAGALLPAALGHMVRRPAQPWLAIIDFSGAHGESVRWLAEAVAERPGTAETFWLDAQTDRDEVSDLDVVRQLCAVVERTAQQPELRPVINMSFGRPLASTDPVSGVPCGTNNLACQIKTITQHVVARHGVVVASAGVQRQWLFPGVLDEVISAGMLDTSAYLADGVRRAAWEMPVEPGAPTTLMPGNSLCLRGGWAAPSGASYATAVMSGWLLQALTQRPGLPLPPDAGYAPLRQAQTGCHILADANGRELTACAATTDFMFTGLHGAFAGVCWAGSEMPKPVHTALGTIAQAQPVLAAAVEWQALVRPTPEGDPCVPCTSSNLAASALADTAVIAMGKQSGLQTQDILQGVFLRLDDGFYEVQLDAAQLQAVHAGGVSELHIAGAFGALVDAESASLFFSVRDAAAQNCDVPADAPPACVWLSTPVHRAR